MIYNNIKNDLVQAIKNRSEQKEYIKVVIAEFDRIGKDLSDEECLKILKRMKKDSELMKNQEEIDYLDKYLPTLMSEDQIRHIIGIARFNGNPTVADIMKTFNTTYKGQADNSLVSKIAKELL